MQIYKVTQYCLLSFRRILLPALFLVLFEFHNTHSSEIAAFTLINGSVKQAHFVIMKSNFIFVKIAQIDGTYEKICFNKSLVKKVVFLNGRELNLSQANSPPEFNEVNSLRDKRIGFTHKTITRPEEFKTFQEEIAVKPLSANGIAESEVVAITDALRGSLSNTGRYLVMEREQMAEVLKEQAFQQTGACEEECVVEMGQLLGVKYIVTGNVSRVGKAYSVNIRMIDVATGKISKDIQQLCRGSKDVLITSSIPVMAQRISGMYVKKGVNKKILIPTISAGALAAVAIPIAIIRSNKGSNNTPRPAGIIEIEWGQ